MSSDSINPIGGRVQKLNFTGPAAPPRAVNEAPKAETSNNVAAQTPTEGFSPTSEARESRSEDQAGAAKASEILGAWGASSPAQSASAGELSVSGASNTSVNQVHGVKGGVYEAASNGSKPGFTGGTVYSQKAPFA
ncbi:MAG TPA: hypothetical protein EYO33_26395 [Phycisphaerales bacterium]|nr:hypothetical protein [Phycisphaerales bacterium]